MCGICGQYNFKDQAPIIPENIIRMTKTLAHRGPDDEGYYFSGPLGFGFRRLSIIDLTGGHQPMSDQGKSIWVIFNGEIYNFLELRKELESYGHIFQTNSDTEVLIHGYKQWGLKLFDYLNGMFGLAIWDAKANKLILARDPMGIKLVYYKIEKGVVYFGSEIRAILASLSEKPEVDPVSLNLFLRYRYTPSPSTLFKGIKKLAPGTMLIFEDGTTRLERWYNYAPTPFYPPKTELEASEELLEIYKRAVKRQLISDVPVGLLLSGGIDSGLLLGLMKLYRDSWPTFTVGYGKKFKDDELADAAETAQIFSTQNISVQLDKEKFEASLPKIVSFLEEPVSTSSIVPMYFVSQRAREDVKVALIGQGPDELFGGYPRHIGVRYGSYWRALPGYLKNSLTAVINALPRNETLKRGVYSLATPERMKRYQYIFSIISGPTIDGLFKEGALPHNAGDKVLEYWKDLEGLMDNIDELGGLQFIELRSSLPDELLMFADKLSMAHGLEVRVPYLDREVVEYVEKLPARFKIRNGTGKWIHRQVCQNFLPKAILRRKTRGFAVNVVDDWFRDSSSRKIEGYLLDNHSLMYQLLKPQAVQKLLKEHISNKSNYYKILSSLVILEEWLRSI